MVLADLTAGLPALLGLVWLKDLATVLFFLFFVGVIVLLVVRGKAHYEPQSRIPLEDDVVEPREVR
ncbi:hypothetical protein [Engelhardtia mirabilis]|uniref:Cbb3-type cytochrome oxidase component FixQ n=1 Tax=Engelhardtia mirabilis TaxID=2528011 RepID=A0A518BIK7_9BACT|nr:hypothetical protein Pla133_18590 [Planctomycetes bacterium Pla133]QDV01109.1 hypothetical protein Pla86_18580 [Planctomycetes bacterium Pla86]